MECGDDSNRFTNSAGSANRENVCMDGFSRIQGLENEEYGIMNVRMNCIGSNDYMDSNSNRNGRWNPMLSCSEGVFTGLEVRVKSGSENGIINFKALCTNLPKGRKLMSHKAIIKHFFNNCLYIFFYNCLYKAIRRKPFPWFAIYNVFSWGQNNGISISMLIFSVTRVALWTY